MNRPRLPKIQLWLVLLIGCLVCATSVAAATVQALSPQQFKSLYDQHRGDNDFVLLDVRTPQEFAQGHIDGAVLLNFYAADFAARLKTQDKDKTYLIYCRSGNRSAKSLAIFEKLGFRRAYHLETGLVGWFRADYPLVRQPSF